MTDKILDNLMLLSQYVCNASDLASGVLKVRIRDLEEYLETIRAARDMTFSSDDK